MIAVIRKSRPAKTRRRLKPNPARFAASAFAVPESPGPKSHREAFLLAALILAGTFIGASWPQDSGKHEPADDIFVMEEEISPPPTEPPSVPPMPEPPPPKAEQPPEPPPPPQFGLEEGDLGATGDLAVAAGNTLMKEAEPEAAPPPPPLPPAPEFVDQPPRILKGQAPEYPVRALDRGLEGTVVALITIDASGAVTEVAIEKGAGADFDQCVRQSARRTLFQPPVRNGRRVPARFRRPYEFKLE